MFAAIALKFKQRYFYREIWPTGAGGMAYSVDPDQTAPLACLSIYRIRPFKRPGRLENC